ncbi:LuxR C-terminal-related transcriptional regulator [Luteimonas kalidii]|uniref:LuxR C-terminal-related transcriptional regulator n=1 Tax=Luteimonas kalidii TaxID=3042025 RepID=A0ABT6JQ59_9GAMM|nr:LuxR C-terminal-related transcriptional regulator [Luteimonas kalidii]MDH5832824.1 LuxR C-terminal-related transcriptional regulator [Luteimonas kalidii]
MNQHSPLLFVLVDARRWQESAGLSAIDADAGIAVGNPGPEFVAMGGGDNPPCVLVRAADLEGIEERFGEWMLATATRFADAQERYGGLTPRERQALPLITDGLLNKQAASAMGISEATLQIHRRRIMEKMGARSFAELVRIADVLGVSAVGARSPHAHGPTRTGVAHRRTPSVGDGAA